MLDFMICQNVVFNGLSVCEIIFKNGIISGGREYPILRNCYVEN